MKRALPLLCLVLLTAVPAQAGKSADAQRAGQQLIAAVEPRRGIQVRSLVLVPLVAKAVPEEGGPRLTLAQLTWRPHAGAAERDVLFHELEPTEGERKPAPVVLPTGLMLQRDGRERLVTRPGFVSAGRPAILAAPPLPGAVPGDAETAGFGPLATPAQRRLLFRRPDAKSIGKLVAFEAGVAGLDPAKKGTKLAEIAAVPEVAKAVKAVLPRLRRITRAYGGEVLGHVVYLGNRPIDLVLAASPDVYASVARQAAPGLALSLVLWERWFGKEGDEPPEMSWPDFIEATERIVGAIKQGTVRRQKPPRRKGEDVPAEAGSLWRVKGRTLNGGTNTVELGWLLLDDEGKPLLLEAWPEPRAPPLPAPARKPGGRGVDEDPYDRKSGALTEAFLERLLLRLKQRSGGR